MAGLRSFNTVFCLTTAMLVAAHFSLGQIATAQDSSPQDASGTPGGPESHLLFGQTAAFGVLSDDVQLKMGFKCATNQFEDVVISDIVPGTAASDCHLIAGDKIVDAQLNGNALDISIERDGKLFKARLKAVRQADPVLVSQQAKMDNTPRKPLTLGIEQRVMNDNVLVPEKGALMDSSPKLLAADAKRFSLDAEQNARLLADYNLELIVDRSNSMHRPDCPGGLSRWDWCGAQAGQLSKSLAPYTPTGLTIVPFASEYDVFEHAVPESIDRIFSGIRLQNGTRLYEPLTERLDNYFVHRKADSKPLLIVIVTDGVPSPRFEPAMVKQTLIEASQKMKSAGDVTVIFCQIGAQDKFGERYLTDLDQNLMTDGARYHFVHAIAFDSLQNVGLGPALVASIKQYAPAQQKAPPRPAGGATRVAPKPSVSLMKSVRATHVAAGTPASAARGAKK